MGDCVPENILNPPQPAKKSVFFGFVFCFLFFFGGGGVIHTLWQIEVPIYLHTFLEKFWHWRPLPPLKFQWLHMVCVWILSRTHMYTYILYYSKISEDSVYKSTRLSHISWDSSDIFCPLNVGFCQLACQKQKHSHWERSSTTFFGIWVLHGVSQLDKDCTSSWT